MPSWTHSFSVHLANGVPVRSTASLKKPPSWPRVGRARRDLLGVDVDRPVEVGRRVPLRRLRLLVELHERRAAALVVPREDGVEVRADVVHDRVDVGVGDREDRLEIVDLVAADEISLLVAHRDDPFGGNRPIEAREDEVLDECADALEWSTRSAFRTAQVREADADEPLGQTKGVLGVEEAREAERDALDAHKPSSTSPQSNERYGNISSGSTVSTKRSASWSSMNRRRS